MIRPKKKLQQGGPNPKYKLVNSNNKDENYDVDVDNLRQVAATSIGMGYDPKLAMAVALQESGMGRVTPMNMFHTLPGSSEEDWNTTDSNEYGIKALQYKKQLANRLGYNTPEMELQAFNGLGKLLRRNDLGKDYKGSDTAYGIKIPKEGIDMRKNPLYGKKVLQLKKDVIDNDTFVNQTIDYYNKFYKDPDSIYNTKATNMENVVVHSSHIVPSERKSAKKSFSQEFSEMIKNVFQKGGLTEDISKMGYRDDSPYRNNPYNVIHTPNGVIDMSQTGIPLLANGRYLAPYSGEHQFNTTKVMEKPAGNIYQQGGLSRSDLLKYLFESDSTDDEEGTSSPSEQEIQDATPEQPYNYDQEEYEYTMQLAQQSLVDDPYREQKTIHSTPYGTPGSAVPNAEILSDGAYGSEHVGKYGHQIYSEISQTLGYKPVVNSIYRDPQQQQQLVNQGIGAKNSYHLTGDAVDLKPTDWNRLGQDGQKAMRSKYDVIYHNNHYHLEPKG